MSEAPRAAPGGGAGALPPPLTAAATVEERSAVAGGGVGPVPLVGGGAGFTFPRLAGAGAPSPAPGPARGGDGRRGKVPLEVGCSQMTWLRTAQELERARPRPRRDVTRAEVARHGTPEDCWTVLRGRVYALSPYFRFHPGGARILDQVSGKDCTRLFQKYHAWVNERMLIGALLVGELAPDEQAASGGGGPGQGRGQRTGAGAGAGGTPHVGPDAGW